MMAIDLLSRKQTHFVLWRPGKTEVPPTLWIGVASPSTQKVELRKISLQPDPEFPELWQVAAQDCELTDGQVYHYWFKIQRCRPEQGTRQMLYCTDPLAYTVDRRFLGQAPAELEGVASYDPASVILYRQGQLMACDPAGQVVNWDNDPALEALPPNHRLVIYELPTRWTKAGTEHNIQVGTGTFRDVIALLKPEAAAPNFPKTEELKAGQAHLLALGVNALELLPPADSGDKYSQAQPTETADEFNDDPLKWGYGTDNYFAADYDLGFPANQSAPTASTDLVELIQLCHQQGIRFFLDVVMAFSRYNAYADVNFLDFYIHEKDVNDPTRDPEQGKRYGFGGHLFKYNYWVDGYDPITGRKQSIVPARAYLTAYLTHWMQYYRVDGLRLDSVDNIGNYDFLQEFRDFARQLWAERGGQSDRFLVVGEELSVPLALLHQNRLDGLWNERFKQILRYVILGKNFGDEPSFEWSVRKLIDCRLLGFRDGTQAVNYITSHDVGGAFNKRIYNYLVDQGVHDTEKRIKLAFVCLLTAVGIPMILAGDEFADQHDLDISNEHGSNKQIDPVKYQRMDEDWRRRIFNYVSRLVKFRIASDALSVDDTVFIHSDFEAGKRVLVWKRGYGETIAVVVANFSDYSTPASSPVSSSPSSSPSSLTSSSPSSPAGTLEPEYVIPQFPPTPAGKHWREVTQDRIVPEEWIGREPIYAWEAKVYELIER